MAAVVVDGAVDEAVNGIGSDLASKGTPSSASFNWDEVDWSKFSPEEAHRMRHRMVEEKHRGHDLMHAEMILILFGSIAIAQIVLFVWRQKHRKSYQGVTLFGLWVIPFYVSVRLFFWRMLCIWLLFTAITGVVMYRATRRRISTNTPRLVYRWFLLIYQITYGLGIFGYVILLLIFTGIGFFLPFHPDTIMEFGVTMVFYGIYYGVMGRDCAELCVDYMAASFTYTSSGQSLPKVELTRDMCAVCGQRIVLASEDNELAERTYKLSCNHLFHEFCIRGWCLVGKKQTCPYCREKVDLKRMFHHPWEKPHVLFGQLLDFIRYFVVWLPAILISVQIIYYLLDLK